MTSQVSTLALSGTLVCVQVTQLLPKRANERACMVLIYVSAAELNHCSDTTSCFVIHVYQG